MTPFGQKIRQLRQSHNITLKEMAQSLQLSSAYLSSLEHGRRGQPSPRMVHQICAYFNIIWDDAEELQRLAKISHPKITVDTSGLSVEATELANRLAKNIRSLDKNIIKEMIKLLDQ